MRQQCPFWEAAIEHSLSLLDKHNIAHAGAGINRQRGSAAGDIRMEGHDIRTAFLYVRILAYWTSGQ